jgi:hypothetical protein
VVERGFNSESALFSGDFSGLGLIARLGQGSTLACRRLPCLGLALLPHILGHKAERQQGFNITSLVSNPISIYEVNALRRRIPGISNDMCIGFQII